MRLRQLSSCSRECTVTAARSLSAVLAAAAILAPGAALAHTGAGDAHGFAHGLLHPVTGLDHVLAMVMVGVLAWQMGGTARWLVPAAFVALMAAGGALGIAGVAVPMVELGITLSVIVLGAVVALGLRAPVLAAVALVGAFAVFHGHAHGAEMPENAGGLAYGAGFMLGTALLHLAGLGIGYAIAAFGERYSQMAVRAVGGLVSLAGIGILAGLI
jgi:urease accessory protein